MEITEVRVKVVCRAEKKKNEYIGKVCSDPACESCKGTGSYETWANPDFLYALFEDRIRWIADERIERERNKDL